MVRNALTAAPDLVTWPCDEINYIWRHGNVRYPTDEFPAELARHEVRSYIRRAFQRLKSRNPDTRIVEKTCANSLRVDFVRHVLPEAEFIEVVRDGRDVVVSAMARWNASLDLPYVLKKARWVPFTDLPYYAVRYAWNRVYRLLTGGQRLAFWGPQFAGMGEALAHHSLAEVCALQWRRCVERSHEGLSGLPADRVYRIRYEDFVADPESEFRRILEFTGVSAEPSLVRSTVANVTDRSVGRWQEELSATEQEQVHELIGDILNRNGYG